MFAYLPRTHELLRSAKVCGKLRWKRIAVVTRKYPKTESGQLEIVNTLNTLRFVFSQRQRGQDQRCEYNDNYENHDQLDHFESALSASPSFEFHALKG